MNENESNLLRDDAPIRFSKSLIIAMVVVAIYGFGLLLTLTFKAYDDKPPIPD